MANFEIQRGQPKQPKPIQDNRAQFGEQAGSKLSRSTMAQPPAADQPVSVSNGDFGSRFPWYVDGIKVREISNDHWFFPMQMLFDSEAMWQWFGPVDDKYLPATFNVDYVRVWRRQD